MGGWGSRSQKASRFANNPEAVQKALAIYNGTYE